MGDKRRGIQDREDKNNDGPDYPADRTAEAVRKGLHQTGEEVHQARQERIPEDRHRHSHRVWPHGLHWVFRQAHPHPHKQHYCGGLGPCDLKTQLSNICIVCCCVLLCVAVCCCVLLCVAVCCRVLPCVAVCCR